MTLTMTIFIHTHEVDVRSDDEHEIGAYIQITTDISSPIQLPEVAQTSYSHQKELIGCVVDVKGR